MSDNFEERFFDLLTDSMDDIKKSINSLVEAQKQQDKNMAEMQTEIKNLYVLHDTCNIDNLSEQLKTLEKETTGLRFFSKNIRPTLIVVGVLIAIMIAKDIPQFISLIRLAGI